MIILIGGFLGCVLLIIILFAVLRRIAYIISDTSRDMENWCIVTGVGIVFLVFLAIIFLVSIPFYYGAEIEVKILNEKYGTSYTTSQYFWSGNLINKIIKTEKNLIDTNNRLNLRIQRKDK